MSTTYQPKRHKRARSHGFLARKGRAGGRAVIRARRRKGRQKLVP